MMVDGTGPVGGAEDSGTSGNDTDESLAICPSKDDDGSSRCCDGPFEDADDGIIVC